MSWDFDSFNESGFNGFIDSGFDARGGTKAVIWKISPSDGSTIWASDWTDIATFTSPIPLLAVTSTHVIAVYLSANLLTMFIKTLTIDGLPVDAYTLTSTTGFSRQVMLHVPTGHLMWISGSNLYRYNPIAKTYALNGVVITTPFGGASGRNFTSTANGDIVWANALTNGVPEANRFINSGQTGASSQIAAGGNIAERLWRSNSQASTGLASASVNTANADKGFATYAGYNIANFTSIQSLATLSGNYIVPCVSGSDVYDVVFATLTTYVLKAGGWTIQTPPTPYNETFPPSSAASPDAVFVGTGGATPQIGAFASNDGAGVWTKTFNGIARAPFQMTIGPDGALYAATDRAS